MTQVYTVYGSSLPEPRTYSEAFKVMMASLIRGKILHFIAKIFRYRKTLSAIGVAELLLDLIPGDVPDYIAEGTELSFSAVCVIVLLSTLISLNRFRDPIAHPDPRAQRR